MTAMASPGGAAEQERLASFATYAEAQRLVDRMSDEGFPVERVRIVGQGVRSIEQVTGRLTKGRAALAGAASGAWLGLLIGLLFGIFAVGPFWLWAMLISAALGALWGALFGFIAHSATGGMRDFSSVRTLEAERYDVFVDTTHAQQAAPYRSAAVRDR
ncbi:MAG: general stress protein [Acidimicrobiia bacterium]